MTHIYFFSYTSRGLGIVRARGWLSAERVKLCHSPVCTWPAVLGLFRVVMGLGRVFWRVFVSASWKIITNATQELLEAMFLSGCLHPFNMVVSLSHLMPHLDSTLVPGVFFFFFKAVAHFSPAQKSTVEAMCCLKMHLKEALTKTKRKASRESRRSNVL